MGWLQVGVCPGRVLGCDFLGPVAGVLAEVYLVATYLLGWLFVFCFELDHGVRGDVWA